MLLETYEHEAVAVLQNPLVVKTLVVGGLVLAGIGATRWALRKVMGN
jgi:hypothetical protein